MRAMTSVGPAAAKGTITFTALSGQVCAAAMPGRAAISAASSRLRMIFTASSRYCCRYHCLDGKSSKRGRNAMTAKKYTRQDLRDAAEKYKNWGKWGPNDEIGTLNYTTAED